MVIIDRRDGSRELAGHPDLRDRCVLGDLEFGDVMLSGHGPDGGTMTIGVEVKSIYDLLSSISTGRLGGHQIPGLLRSYDRCYLLVYGDWRPGSNGHLQVRKGSSWRTHHLGRQPMPWAYLEGFLMTCSLKGGVGVKTTYDKHEAGTWLAILDKWLEKPWDKHKALEVFNTSQAQAPLPNSDPTESLMARLAAQLSGIGWDRGWSIAKHFESPFEMFTADAKEWMKVKKVGPVIAKSAVESIRRRKG